MPYYDVFNEEICISVNMSVSIAMRVVYLCVFISCKALMVQCTTNIYFNNYNDILMKFRNATIIRLFYFKNQFLLLVIKIK